MKYLKTVIIVTLFAVIGLCAATATASPQTSQKNVTSKLAKRDARLYRGGPPKLERRIATGFYNSDPQQQSSYYPTSGGAGDLYQAGDYSQHAQSYQQGPPQHHYPQYIEAPEPIIEIIIKESNDTLDLPVEEPVYIPGSGGKKKKEQVQVFYVKYKNDPHKGVIIDDPVAALSPNAYHQENDDYEEEQPQNDEQQPLIVTLPPPVKTTTLRTIIRPDSEKFHSNSGIHVTFGTEDKSQQGHQLQEENEESNIQPVVALPTATIAPQTNIPQAHHHKFFENHQQQQQLKSNFQQHQPPPQHQQSFQSNEFHSRFGQQARYYNTNNNNEVFPPLGQGLVNGQQQLPFIHSPSQPFRLPGGGAGGPPPPPHPTGSQPFPKHSFNAQATNYPRPPFHPQQQQQQRIPDQERNLVGSSAAPFVQQLPSLAPPPPFRNVPSQGPPQLPPPAGFHQHPHPHQQRPHGPPPAGSFNQPPPPPSQQSPSVRFPSGPPNNGNVYPQQQHHHQKFRPNQPLPSVQPPQHRPIPIPLHQFDQQKPPQVGPTPNFHPHPQQHQQQQQQPPHFNGPLNPPFRQREPLQAPLNNAQPFNNFNVAPSSAPIQGGGLVQQAAPNLSREQPQPHHQLQVQQQQQQYHQQQQQQFQNNPPPQQQQFQNNPPPPQQQQQHQQQQGQQNTNSVLGNIRDIASGGELIQSVAKYEQHIIEQAPQFHYAQQQQVNYAPEPIISSSPAPVVPLQKPNIGPLANNIGHLNTFSSSTPVAPLRTSQPEIQQSFGSSDQHQQYIQQQIHDILREPQQQQQQSQDQYYGQQQQQQQHQQQQANIQPQIIPNSQPVQPGQSVSTHYSEIFPSLEQQRQQYYKSLISNQPQDQLQQVVNINGRNNVQSQGQIKYESSSIYTPTTYSTTTPRVAPSTTTTHNSPPTTTSPRSANKPSAVLPDEVPDDLRQQLLSSGILDNADISILDYDKIGSTNLENLPQEHLVNFFNAGGGAQIAASNQVLTVVKPNGEKIGVDYNNKEKVAYTKKAADKAIPQKQNVDLKVVRFDSTNQKSVSDKYIKSDSHVLPTVEINSENHQYNRYLPLKLNGAQFPIPDVPELRGKRITSVVVLAPVDNNNLNGDQVEDDGRYERDVVESKPVKFIAGDALKQLIKKPTKENFKKWLEREANTEIDFQSVVLLVAKDPKSSDEEKEIFMYDITTQSVNKLSGELSTAFVNVAESNAQTENIDSAQIVDSGIVEQMDAERDSSSPHFGEDEFVEKEIQDRLDELEAEPSDLVETRIKYDLPANHKYTEQDVVISSGYSVIKN